MQFIDLKAQYHAYQGDLDSAVAQVLESAQYINGPAVGELERELAAFVGVRHAVGFSSGTDALLATLMAWGVGPGDEVITTPFTFIATAEVIALLGAKPVFVDVEPDTLNIDASLVEAAITPATKAILPVSLYGQCPDLAALGAIARRHGLKLLEDACQSFGAEVDGRRSCGLTDAGATSFFPAKPLGCYGDGGMAFTDDEDLAQALRIIREHGQPARYQHDRLGINGRLDTLQAAVLRVKLRHFPAEIAARQEAAARYRQLLDGVVRLPVIRPGRLSVYAQYTIRVAERDQVVERIKNAGVPVAVHYPVPLHRQPVFASLGGSFPQAEQAAAEVLSLPMHPFLTAAQQEQVAAAVKAAV